MKAVDYSSFSTGQPVPVSVFQTIRSFSPHDMLLNIAGAWHGGSGNPWARQSLINGREAGFSHSATYTALNMQSGRTSVERALQFVGDDEWDKLAFIGIDVELPTTPDIIAEACAAARQMVMRPVIYTAKWAWQQFMVNSPLFAEWPLWNAFYDDDPDIDFANNRYGGWSLSALIGEQYTNTTYVGRLGFDFNYFADGFVKAEDAPQVPPLVALVEAWKTDMANLAVNAADLIPTPLDTLRLALHSIYTSRRTEDWKSLLGK